MPPRTEFLRALLRLILLAALASAPIFLFAEGFSAQSALRVAASNGVAALLCAVLLRQVGRGHETAIARWLVGGLLALVVGLASSNGEAIHVNVVNFVLVTLLASVLIGTRGLLLVAAISAVAMAAIAWRQAVAPPGEEIAEARLEAIAQFLPTYAVIVAILWRRERADTGLTRPSARNP